MSRDSGWPGFRERSESRGNPHSLEVEHADVARAGGATGDIDVFADDLGPIRFIHLNGGAVAIRRAEGDIGAAEERCFTFLLQVRGSALFRQYGDEVALRPGDLSLCDDGAPYSYACEEACEVVMLRVPDPVLRESLPSPHACCCRRLGSGQDLVSTAGAMARSLLDQLKQGLSGECRQRAARHLLAIISSCYFISFDRLDMRSSLMAGRHWCVRLFIEQKLRDPELSPAMIAAHLKLSSRYLRMIFAANNESISAYVLRRRLEECAARLVDPRWAGHGITEIAFSWGFNSAPHFTRSFREHFGLSPRDYRATRSTISAAGSLANRRRGDKVEVSAAARPAAVLSGVRALHR